MTRLKALPIIFKLSPEALAWLTARHLHLECLVEAKRYGRAIEASGKASSQFDVAAHVANFLRFPAPARIAVFGAGQHTKWLEQIAPASERFKVLAVLDENPAGKGPFWNLSVTDAASFRPSEVDAIILSSDCYQAQMRRRCAKLYGEDVRLIDLYEGLPQGPYKKT